MIFPVAHQDRTYFGDGDESLCVFCDEPTSWCKCKQNCNAGFHIWADNCEKCVYCHISKQKAVLDKYKE